MDTDTFSVSGFAGAFKLCASPVTYKCHAGEGHDIGRGGFLGYFQAGVPSYGDCGGRHNSLLKCGIRHEAHLQDIEPPALRKGREG